MDPRFNQAADAFNPYIYGELQLKNSRFTARFAREKKPLWCFVVFLTTIIRITSPPIDCAKKKNAFYFLKFSPASLNHRRSADSSATDARMSIATRLAAFSYLAMPRMSTKKFQASDRFLFSLFFRPVKHIPSLSRGRSLVVIAAHRKVDILFSFQFEDCHRAKCVNCGRGSLISERRNCDL